MPPDEAAKWEQTWEKAKKDTEKFVTDAAIMLQGNVNPAFVANTFAAMGVRTGHAYTASTMAVLLVQLAQSRLRDKGLLSELPPDPFVDPPTAQEQVEAFANDLTALTIRHGIALDTVGSGLRPVVLDGDSADMGDLLAIAFQWDGERGRYTCTSPDGGEPPWQVP